jgi:hypothetical protein
MNLFAYLSQVSVIPYLLELYKSPEYQGIAETLLRLLAQQWQGSLVSFFNNLAYAVLGIPSIIYGYVLAKGDKTMAAAGMLLALNGVACILGIIGIAMGNSLLSWGSAIGGGLYFLSLIPLSYGFLRNPQATIPHRST